MLFNLYSTNGRIEVISQPVNKDILKETWVFIATVQANDINGVFRRVGMALNSKNDSVCPICRTRLG